MKKKAQSQHQQPVSVVMVGISGMGLHYLIALLEEFSPDEVELRAVVDPFPERSKRYLEIKNRGIPIFYSLSEYYKDGHSAELVVISSPIHYHVPQSCEALRHGSHVLCEKPLGVTIQEVERLVQERDAARRWVMIGYQWSYSAAIQALKKDILKGLLGKPVRLKTLCFWPRDEDYYKKSSWLGRKKDNEGNWILDSPANNAMAHFLHNLFYVLGDKIDTSAKPVEVKAELYRAFHIENFDSIACRVFTQQGSELLFYASHAVPQDQGPMFSFEFEHAKVTYGEIVDDITARDRQGKEKHFGSPERDHNFRKLFEAVAAARKPKLILCGPEAARSQTLCVNGIQESASEIMTFPESMVRQERETKKRWVDGLAEAFYECYQSGILPSEADYSWARAGSLVDLRNYQFFPGGISPGNQKERKS